MANKSIDLSIYSFTNHDLANALLLAHQRDVTVRIITDNVTMDDKGSDT